MNAVVEHQPLAIPSETQSTLVMIERAAANPKVNIEKMRQLLDMHREILREQKEQLFNEAMSACQGEIERVATDARNSHTNSNYATYAALDRAVRPIYTRHGFGLSFDEADCPKVEHVRVTCLVTHRTGFSRLYHRDMPSDGKGAKGNDVMTKTHAVGSAQQYGMRYLLKGIFNIAIGQDPDDDDGNGAGGKKVERLSVDQVTVIRDLLQETRSSESHFLAWLKCDRIENIPAHAYQDCKRAIEAKRERVVR